MRLNRVSLVIICLALGGVSAGRVVGQDVPGTRRIICARPTDSKVIIDGLLEESCWQEAEQSGEFTLAGSAERPAAQTTVRTVFDQSVLYIAVECEEPAMDKVVATHTQRDSDVWYDDCIEVYLQPGEGDYFHIIVNTSGIHLDEVRSAVGGGADRSWDSALEVRIAKQADGWLAELAIPFASLGVQAPQHGERWQANFCRERYAGQEGEFSSWNRTRGGFNDPGAFGVLVFGSYDEALRELRARLDRVARLLDELDEKVPAVVVAEMRARLDKLEETAAAPIKRAEEFQALDLEVQELARDARHVDLGVWTVRLDTLMDDAGQWGLHCANLGADPEYTLSTCGETKKMGAASLKLQYSFSRPDDSYIALVYRPDQPLDWTSYGDLTWWVYSPHPLAERTKLYLYDAQGRYACYQGVHDRGGWQAFTGRLRTPSYYGKSGETDLSNITRIALYVVNNPQLADGQQREIYLDGVELTSYLHAERASYAVWLGDALTPAPTTGIPEDVTPNPTQIRIEALGNEWESRSLVVSNLTSEPLHLRVVLTDFQDLQPGGQIIPADFAQLRVVAPIPLRGGTSAYDALPKLGEAGIIVVPSKGNQEIFLTVNTKHLEPGEYEGYLMMLPLAGGVGRKSTSIRLIVLPVRLPDYCSLQIAIFEVLMNHEYRRFRTTAERVPYGELRERELEPQLYMPERYIRDIAEHGVTVFRFNEDHMAYPVCDEQGKLVEVMDQSKFASFDRLMRIYSKYCPPRELLITMCPMYKRLGYPHSPYWKENTKKWVQGFVGYLKSLGFGYEDFMLHAFDEIGVKGAKEFAEFCAVIKEAEPSVRMMIPFGAGPALETMKIAAPYIDIWDVHVSPHLRDPDTMQFLRSTGKPIWFYDNSIPRKWASALSARLQSWIARAKGLQGYGHWAYDRFVGDAWDDEDMRGLEWPQYSDCIMVYPGTEGPIPTRRWEAFRDGVEDYEYLCLLEKHATEASGAEALLEAVKGQVPKSAAEVHELRARMLKVLSSLSNK